MSADETFNYREAFSRNIGLVSDTEQAQLRNTRVAIAGLGGVGGVYLLTLARLGIGRFALSDFDRFELANFNRQVGATVQTLGEAKIEVMANMAKAINPTAELQLFPSGIDDRNIDTFLEGSLVALDGIDFFNMEARRLLFRRARELGVYAVTAAPVGFGATLHVFSPTGMSFDEYFDLRDPMSLPEQLFHFVLGLAPKRVHRRYFPPSAVDFEGRRAPSLAPGCLMCAALVATEVANLVLRRRPPRVAPAFSQFDPLVQSYKAGRLRLGNRNLIQRAKKRWALLTNRQLRDALSGRRS